MPFQGIVVIVAHKAERWIRSCIHTVVSASANRWQFCLVDNDEDGKIVSQMSHEPTIYNRKTPAIFPFAQANNFALVNMDLTEPYVCFLNQDTKSYPGWLDTCVEVLERRPEVGAVMPLITTYDGDGWDSSFLTCAKAAPELFACLSASPPEQVNGSRLNEFYPVPEITAAAMVVRASVLKQVGPFDPVFQSYYEDYDLCRRIRAAGYEVGICPRGRVAHYGGSATQTRAAHWRRARLITRNRVIYQIRLANNRKSALLRYWSLTFPRNLVRSAIRRPATPPLSAFLAAHVDLIKLSRRLWSRGYDEKCFRDDLRRAGWRW